MLNTLEDYYRILQVHHLAEPEVIEGAYRRLAKKYHPDVNKSQGAEDILKRINRAYEELHDPGKRRQYDVKWKAAHPPQGAASRPFQTPFQAPPPPPARPKNEYYEQMFTAAKAVLTQYFEHLTGGRFDDAYALVSSVDRKNISYEDFARWQRAVAVVFHLKEYTIKPHKIYSNKPLNSHIFKQAAEFNVQVTEYNAVMDILARDVITKIAVQENGLWRVFVGYEELQTIISRFQTLTDLLSARSIMNELTDRHSRIDPLSGLLNQKGLDEKIESEIYRWRRYGNVFSFAMVETRVQRPDDPADWPDICDLAVKAVGQALSSNLRKLDAAGRWDAGTFLVLLPETNAQAAAKVCHKLHDRLRNAGVMHRGKGHAVSVKIACAEYRTTLEEALDKISRQLRR
jgi:diguanylate cyclase (GGDEF)-like protein